MGRLIDSKDADKCVIVIDHIDNLPAGVYANLDKAMMYIAIWLEPVIGPIEDFMIACLPSDGEHQSWKLTVKGHVEFRYTVSETWLRI